MECLPCTYAAARLVMYYGYGESGGLLDLSVSYGQSAQEADGSGQAIVIRDNFTRFLVPIVSQDA